MRDDTIVVLVNGEVLADSKGASISRQRGHSDLLAEGLSPLLRSKMKVAVLHGNKPQVGFVLFRAEIASHVLHSIPLDVCGADTQGASGYILSQAFMNVLRRHSVSRSVMCTVTQTLVDNSDPAQRQTQVAVGPWYDRERAESYREARNWQMIEEPGRGYRRTVPSLPPIEILEMQEIERMVESGAVVIAGGGGGVPVALNEDGELVGIEAVIETEKIAGMFAQHLEAGVLLMVVEAARKYIVARLSIEKQTNLSLEELDKMLETENYKSRTIRAQLRAASEFLHNGGHQVIITTLERLPSTLKNESGLWIGKPDYSLKIDD